MPYDDPKACVFWDFLVPNGEGPDRIYQNIPYCLEKLICVSRLKLLTDELVHVYKEAGITILPVPDDEYARVHYMVSDILLWTVEFSL